MAVTEAMANVLAERYASRAMASVWSPERRVVLERRLWLAVLRAQRRLGLDVPDGVIEAYEAVVDQVDLSSIQAREAVTRHDVKARIDEFCALAGHQHIHRGMTSRDLTENVEQLQVRESLELIRADLAAVIGGLADRAERHASQAMVARTHNVAAQATTLGKRFADAAEESMLGYERIDELLARYPLRGIKGAVGTRVDQLDWAAETAADEPEHPAEAGDEIGRTAGAAAVDELEREVADYLGFDRVLDACGQVYPRSLDLDVVAALVQAACGPASLAVTIRLMAGHELVSEGFRPGQVGSSAMPHKMNARSCERIGALRTVLDGHLTMAAGLAGRQWNEGDVTCSAVRRVMLPDAFFAADGLLHTARAVLAEMEVFDASVAAELDRHLPDLATARLLAALVSAGVGREAAHELISEHARAAVRARREGTTADLVDKLAADDRVPLARGDLEEVLAEPASLAGSAADQVARVVARARAVTARCPEAQNRTYEVRF